MFKLLLVSICFSLYSSVAYAQETKADTSKNQETRVAFRGVGEAWADPNVGQVYRSSRFFGFLGFGYKLRPNYSVDIEGGFVRVDSPNKNSSLQLVPLSVGGSYLFSSQYVEPFVGGGLSFVNYLETGGTEPVSGTKLGLDFRAGVRLATNFARPSQHPSRARGTTRVDIELMFGQRIHQPFGLGSGLNMGATRLGVGMLLRF